MKARGARYRHRAGESRSLGVEASLILGVGETLSIGDETRRRAGEHSTHLMASHGLSK